MFRKITLFALMFSAVLGFAQQPALQPSATHDSSIIVIASAKGQKALPSLSLTALKSSGITPTGIEKVDRMPLVYAVVFDASNSGLPAFRASQDLAREVLMSIIRPGTDKGFVTTFDTQVHLDAKLTGDPKEIANVIKKEKAGGATALYDALKQTAEQMRTVPAEEGLKLAFVFSDGMDNQSRSTVNQALDALLSAGIRVYALTANEFGMQTRGEVLLSRICQITGGQAFSIEPKRAVAVKAIDTITKDLGNLYRLNYTPLPSSKRPVQVDLKPLEKGVEILAPQYIFPTNQGE